MKIAVMFGRFSSGAPSVYDVDTLYETRGLTGSESMCFNTARGLAERGHTVQVFADFVEERPAIAGLGAQRLGGAACFKLESSDKLTPDTDAVIAFNEPDLLRFVPPSMLRICAQQLNDFYYASPEGLAAVDLFVSPSEPHRQAVMLERSQLPPEKVEVLWNCINLEMYAGAEMRRAHSIAYISSPDRGLHHLLEWWPLIRKAVPDAELRIFYKVDPWIERARGMWTDHTGKNLAAQGIRARYIEGALDRLGRDGKNGVVVVGPVANTTLARELMKTELLVYPCDPITWTEGFSVSIMDACAAGALPIISDVDAIGEIYNDVAVVIPGRPQSMDSVWIDEIVRRLSDPLTNIVRRDQAREFAEKHTRQARAEQWERLIERRRKNA